VSVKYVPVQWTKRKIVYDVLALAGVALYVLAYQNVARATHTGPDQLTDAIVQMRSFGSCAFLMLTVILCIGPLARLDRRFLPLLYNRRHLGVIMFGVVAYHAWLVIGYYHAFGGVPKLVSLLSNDTAFTSTSLPFQLFGAVALVIFFLMFATSHDFWQRLLGARAWKGLHMLVYAAYALVVLHVAAGALQLETDPVFAAMVGGSVVAVVALHVAAARRSSAPDRAGTRWVELDGERWIDAGPPGEIPEGRARPVVVPDGERIALVRHAGKVSAVHGVCAHQGGPLYEGKVLDGCLTCPWHGWTYRPQDGQAPPPFTEKIPTYRVRLSAEGRVLVCPIALPPGTPTEPVVLAAERDTDAEPAQEPAHG